MRRISRKLFILSQNAELCDATHAISDLFLLILSLQLILNSFLDFRLNNLSQFNPLISPTHFAAVTSLRV